MSLVTIDALKAEVARLNAERETLLRTAIDRDAEAFKGNIEAIDKLGIDPMGCQPILAAVQDGDISTGRARELMRCWVLGTFRLDMLPPINGSDLLQAMIRDDESPAEVMAQLRGELALLKLTAAKKPEDVMLGERDIASAAAVLTDSARAAGHVLRITQVPTPGEPLAMGAHCDRIEVYDTIEITRRKMKEASHG